MMQLVLFEPESNWTPPESRPDFALADAIAIDLETCDPNLLNSGPGWPMGRGHVAGIAVSMLHGEAISNYYFPIGHEQGRNMAKKWVLDYIAKICTSGKPIVFHNALYDVGWLSTHDITVTGPIFDTMAAAALLDENRLSYSLDNLGKDWIGLGKDEGKLKDAAAVYGYKTNKQIKSNMWRMPPEHVGPYAERDSEVTLKLWQHERLRLERDGLNELMAIEMSLIPMLTAMRKQGIRIDLDEAQQVQKNLKQGFKDVHGEIWRKFNCKVEVWTSASLAKAFDMVGLEYPRTAKTAAPSFTKEFLASQTHELPKMVLRARKIDKTINTFIEGMILNQSHNGRIHCELHPLKSDEGGTVSGRLSASNPNLQQTSARDPEFGPMVRGLFKPEEGQLWGALDYASQEPRLTVHYAARTNQKGGHEAVAKFQEDPRTDYHQMVADLANIDRKPAKTINLGLAYGMGAVKLCHGLDLPTEMKTNDRGEEYEIAGPEGLEVIEKYHEAVPFVQGLMDTTTQLAQSRGWIKTIGGRHCRFNMWEPRRGWGVAIADEAEARKKWQGGIRRAHTHKALNRLIQGSAADMTKIAMQGIWNEGVTPMLQMHDELDISFDPGAAGKKQMERCVEIMEHSVELLVPIVVDAEFGKTWADAVHPWEDVT